MLTRHKKKTVEKQLCWQQAQTYLIVFKMLHGTLQPFSGRCHTFLPHLSITLKVLNCGYTWDYCVSCIYKRKIEFLMNDFNEVSLVQTFLKQNAWICGHKNLFHQMQVRQCCIDVSFGIQRLNYVKKIPSNSLNYISYNVKEEEIM